MAPDDSGALSADGPIVGPLREPLEATDARRRRQVGERPTEAGDGNAQQRATHSWIADEPLAISALQISSIDRSSRRAAASTDILAAPRKSKPQRTQT